MLPTSPHLPQVLWEVETGRAVCGSPANNNFTLTIKFFNNRNDKLVSAGNYNLLVWQYDEQNNKLRHTEATLGQLQRIFRTVSIDRNDEFAYCGTTTGDVLQVRQRGEVGVVKEGGKSGGGEGQGGEVWHQDQGMCCRSVSHSVVQGRPKGEAVRRALQFSRGSKWLSCGAIGERTWG